MKKLFCLIALLLTVCVSAFGLIACGETPSENNASPQQTQEPTPPTASQFIAARKAVADANETAYDFTVKLTANVSLGKFSGSANAIYDGKYRYNKTTEQTAFCRRTSGILLYDSTEYIYSEGDKEITIKANDKGVIKDVSVVEEDDKELSLINLPFVNLVNGLKAENLTNIDFSSDIEYDYSATIKLTSDNFLLNKVISYVAKQDTNVSIKGLTLTNPANGINLLFNLNDGKVSDFKMSFALSFPIKGINTSLTLTYDQSGNDSQISIPNLNGITISTNDISTVVNKVNTDLTSIKSETSYSLDLTAENQFDPGWNIIATTDKYTARMYKNTYIKNEQEFTAFNHSFEYKTHHEEDGQETYKYTIGNIADGSTHIVSRKGTNTVSEIKNVSADTQFDFVVNPIYLSANLINCVKTAVDGAKTTYTFSLKTSSAINVQSKITQIINSNTAEGVIAVDNYFNNEEKTIKTATVTIVYENGKIKEIKCETESKYFPTGGEYTDSKITLSDSLTLKINENLSKAEKYEAPNSATGNFVGLISAGKYIL